MSTTTTPFQKTQNASESKTRHHATNPSKDETSRNACSTPQDIKIEEAQSDSQLEPLSNKNEQTSAAASVQTEHEACEADFERFEKALVEDESELLAYKQQAFQEQRIEEYEGVAFEENTASKYDMNE